MSLDHVEVLARLDHQDANGFVQAFAANVAFRAAEWEELTTEGNPYRRPVRPDDLAWLDYGKPMVAAAALKLSALLGHRMLRNIYDADLLYLPPDASTAAAQDGAAFYSDRNRVLGALAQPVLESHLFGVLDEEREALGGADPGVEDPQRLKRELHEYYQQRQAEPGAAYRAALSTRDRKASATFVLLQLSAYLPAARAAIGRASLGEFDAGHPGARSHLVDQYRSWAAHHDAYRDLLGSGALEPGAAAYWQLYLGTSLARGNHLHWLSRNRELYPEFLGAWLHYAIDEAAAGPRFADIVEDGLGTRPDLFDRLGAVAESELDALTDRLLLPLRRLYGAAVVERCYRGFADARWLARLWDTDLAAQVTWADDIDVYQKKADEINQYIVDNEIVVDLDTFVESNEETSTTHVHNEHRLVMIEKGQMHFWNNVTHKIELDAGAKLLIPVSRLHGSTVLSGECTYHQPIIPEEMYQRF